jgi:uncharacterized lipoprotein YddW (UPF0748 family)
LKQQRVLQIAAMPLLGLLTIGLGEGIGITPGFATVRFTVEPFVGPVIPSSLNAPDPSTESDLLDSVPLAKEPDSSEWEAGDQDDGHSHGDNAEDTAAPADAESEEATDETTPETPEGAAEESFMPLAVDNASDADMTPGHSAVESRPGRRPTRPADLPSAEDPRTMQEVIQSPWETTDEGTPELPSGTAEEPSLPWETLIPDNAGEANTNPGNNSTESRPGRRPRTPVEIPSSPEQRVPLPVTRPPWQAPPGATNPPASDPAEQIAPAVIELNPNTRTLSLALSFAMQRELRDLMGRFESAWLMANSLDMTTTLAVSGQSPVLTAAAENVNVSRDAGEFLHPALENAQNLLDDWNRLITDGKHQEARDRWLAAREALWENFPAERPFAQAEMRAVWLDRGTIVEARNPAGLAEIFDRLADAGITTVFFETVNAGYPIYPSQVAPQQNPLTIGWDPLQAAVDLAHQHNMTLHAWVWVFAAGNQRHNRLLNLPADYPGPLLAQHPDWAGYDNTGNTIPIGQDKPFLDPANPEVRSYLIRLMTEIVQQYEVDGLHLDYIRYPFQDPEANRTYGYGEVARWRFRSISGVDPTTLTPRPNPELSPHNQVQQGILWDRWTDFRVQQINSFVATISNNLRRYRSDLILSAAVFANPEHERLQKIQQDWGTWAREGYVDWIVLMSYAEDTSRFSQLINPWLVDGDFASALIIPGIRLLNLDNSAAIDQIQVTRDLPTPGYALFAAADFQTQLETVLANTQIHESNLQSPFRMAMGRYQALQREWHWLLAQQRLWMERDTLTQWIESANQLGEDLQILAEDPSRRQFATAMTNLEAVRAPLNNNILIETANSGYRLQSWQYRLTAIEQLLDYGERTEF